MQEVTSNALEIYTGNNNGDFYIFNPNMDATTVTVYDCMGKIIFTENTSEQKINLSLANHKAGIYFINAFTNTNSKTAKVVLSK
ncbi:MAG: T9SS type A sorting domain-containing protein [Bacteroidetes bacterium]|nr:T9SS type A sorting domain-containing protein [Bacteroidota bacterium]